MTEESDLLRAILDNPEEDTPRLMMADWLQEHGQEERAEFIRLQCDYSRRHVCECSPNLFVKPNCTVCQSIKSVRVEATRILTDMVDDFRPTVAYSWAVVVSKHPVGSDTPISCVWRGFIESITCTAAEWLTHADTITAAHPIREVVLTTLPAIETGLVHSTGCRDCWFSLRESRSHSIPHLQYPEHAYQRIVHTLLKNEWPRITFTLPTQQT